MAMRLDPISPDLWYSAAEAAALVPGRGGGALHPVTMVSWLKSGRVKGREIGGSWFIKGDELMRLRGDEMPAPDAVVEAR